MLTLLARRADDSGFCYPGIGDIASNTKVSRSKVIRSLARLEDLGLLRRARQKRGNGFERNLYTLPSTPPGSVSETPPIAGTSVSQTPPVVSQGHLGSVSQTPEVAQEATHVSNPERRAPKKHKSTRRRSSKPIPEDWKPLDRHHQEALKLGVDCNHVAQKFRAHAEAHDRRCVLWDKAFDNWLLSERKPMGVRNAPQSGVATRVQTGSIEDLESSPPEDRPHLPENMPLQLSGVVR